MAPRRRGDRAAIGIARISFVEMQEKLEFVRF
jgi:hypothetical protein